VISVSRRNGKGLEVTVVAEKRALKMLVKKEEVEHGEEDEATWTRQGSPADLGLRLRISRALASVTRMMIMKTRISYSDDDNENTK